MTTIQAERPSAVDLHHLAAPTAARPVTVPDHVPRDVAAEHPDAAAVVAGRSPRGGVRVVSRGERRSPAGLILGLVACALMAAFTAPASAPAAATASNPSIVHSTPESTPTTPATPSTGCPAGTSVVVRCQPPCAPLAPLSFNLTPCLPATSAK